MLSETVCQGGHKGSGGAMGCDLKQTKNKNDKNTENGHLNHAHTWDCNWNLRMFSQLWVTSLYLNSRSPVRPNLC